MYCIQPLVADQQDKNHLIAQVFRLLAMLVSFGYYDDDEDIEELLPKITDCLDGTQDLLTGSKPKSEKSMSSINAIVIQCHTYAALIFPIGFSKYLYRFSRRHTEEDRRTKGVGDNKFKGFRMKDRFMNKPEFQALFFVKKW
jgi:hypothetical protein